MSDTENRMSNADREPQEENKHPDELSEDLNPNRMAGQNIGSESSAPETSGRTVYDDRELHRAHDELSDQQLKQIPLVPEGMRLQQGATYIDLRDAHPEEFTAQGKETASEDHRYVAKDEVPYPIWNHLIGEEKPGQHL